MQRREKDLFWASETNFLSGRCRSGIGLFITMLKGG